MSCSHQQPSHREIMPNIGITFVLVAVPISLP
jgi:hypothetical protein